MLQRLRRRFLSGRGMNPARIIAGSFACIILIGTLLLLLPISSRSGRSVGGMTALFTATSATCVTGLVLADTWQTWSAFGQGVLLLLIQLGGLGFMTVATLFSLAMGKRIGLSQRLLMVSTLNLNDMDGVVRVVRHALLGTFLLEGAGAVILSACFIPEFGPGRGIWYGIFHSVSAFCNAGFDLMGEAGPFRSLTGYDGHPVVLFTVMFLVVVGGLGFVVWEDVLAHRGWRNYSLYTKIVLVMTGGLLAGGAVFYFLAEYHNPATLGAMPVWKKALNALFQSVTMRTAGFNTIDQAGLGDSSLVMSILLMLTGGSSGSTAGGLKTATVAVLLLSVRAGMRGTPEVTLRGRTVAHERVMNAITLVLTAAVLFLSASMALSLAEGLPFLPCAYEVGSAMGTVGVTTGLTPGLSTFGRLLIIALMYTGRVGLLSFSIAFLAKGRSAGKVKYPTFDIMIG